MVVDFQGLFFEKPREQKPTPPKINIEPENDGLDQMFLLFQGCILRFHVNLARCIPSPARPRREIRIAP